MRSRKSLLLVNLKSSIACQQIEELNMRHNSEYIKLSDYRKQVHKKTRKSKGGWMII
jgi:hypothetical protein